MVDFESLSGTRKGHFAEKRDPGVDTDAQRLILETPCFKVFSQAPVN
jgi:hypothetical protein